jgi:hypothetical protein
LFVHKFEISRASRDYRLVAREAKLGTISAEARVSGSEEDPGESLECPSTNSLFEAGTNFVLNDAHISTDVLISTAYFEMKQRILEEHG